MERLRAVLCQIYVQYSLSRHYSVRQGRLHLEYLGAAEVQDFCLATFSIQALDFRSTCSTWITNPTLALLCLLSGDTRWITSFCIGKRTRWITSLCIVCPRRELSINASPCFIFQWCHPMTWTHWKTGRFDNVNARQEGLQRPLIMSS